jgi:hypothetical protein
VQCAERGAGGAHGVTLAASICCARLCEGSLYPQATSALSQSAVAGALAPEHSAAAGETRRAWCATTSCRFSRTKALRSDFPPTPCPSKSALDDDSLHALWLQAVALYDTSPNPPPDFASVAATKRALRASGIVDVSSFDVVVVAVMGHALHERGDKTLLDYTQVRAVRAVRVTQGEASSWNLWCARVCVVPPPRLSRCDALLVL